MLRFFRRNPPKDKEQTEGGVKPSRERWFGRILGAFRTSRLDDSLWEELEEILISSDVGVEASLRIIEELKERIRAEDVRDPDEAFQLLKNILVQEMEDPGSADVWSGPDSEAAPYVILMVGVNGVGKTTSIAKLARHFEQSGRRVILGAADTFRAAATEQLQVLGERAGVDVISHGSGSDPGAVAYDAFQASRARGADILIIDTAGRLHTKSNLMAELKKVDRVLKRLDPSAPHQVILTLDATTGHNGLAQAKSFKEAVDCTGIFLAKLDGTARGGITLAIRQELGVPIMFIGTGEGLDDLAPFDGKEFVDALLSPVS